MVSRIQPRLRQQLKLLLVAGALAMTGLVALPGADAKAGECPRAELCTSNYLFNFPSTPGGKVYVDFDGWDNRHYQVQVWVNSHTRACEWNIYGHDPPTTLTCWYIPTGSTVFATSSTWNVTSRHLINIRPGW
jgi:hypothetical protein